MTVAPRPVDTAPCRRCRTGRPPRTTSRPRSARSRRRSGPGSRRRAARSRRSSRSIEERVRRRGRPRSPPRRSAARRSGRSSTTPTSRPAPSRPRRWPGCTAAAASSSAATSTASRPWRGTATSSTTSRRNQFFENYRGPADDFFGSVGSKPEIYPIYWSPRADGGPPERPDGHGPGVPERPVDARVRRRPVVRPRPRLALPRPHPPPPAGRQLRRPRHPPRPRHPRPVDDRGLPAGVPAPVRRHRRAVRPVGRRPPHRRPAVPRLDHVLGLPHLPGLDRAVRHGPRPGRAAHRARSPRRWPT